MRILTCLLLLCLLGCAGSKSRDNGPLVQLETTGCFGFCPSYKLFFYNDGNARYEGLRFVKKEGKADFKITAAELQSLREKLRQTDVWQYPAEIESRVVDAPFGIITVYQKGKTHAVKGTIDRPKPLLDLEENLKSLAEAHGLDVRNGVNPRELAEEIKGEVIVKLKPDINAGNWIIPFRDEPGLQLIRRLGADNIWLIGYDTTKIDSMALVEFLKQIEGVVEAQPNTKSKERH